MSPKPVSREVILRALLATVAVASAAAHCASSSSASEPFDATPATPVPSAGVPILDISGGGGANSAQGCSDGTGGVAGASPASEAAASDPMCSGSYAKQTFAHDIAPVFSGCAGEACHGAWTYEAVVNVAAVECCDRRPLVAPGWPSHSYLLQKLQGGPALCYGTSMPPGAVVPSGDLARLVSWICQGASKD